MANFLSYPSVILIFIFACLLILITEGRPLKSLKRSESDFHHHDDQKDGETKLVGAYRPTTPGKSPGAGHAYSEHMVDDESEAMVNFSHVEQSSTEHGHSPGAGHSIHN